MKLDMTNPKLIAYLRAMQEEALAYDERWLVNDDGTLRSSSPEAEIKHEAAYDNAERARLEWAATNDPAMHTHRVYLCFDSYPELKTRFHDDPEHPDEITCRTYEQFYSPQFPDLDFDCDIEELNIRGTLADCQRLAAISELPVDVDPMEEDELGHMFNWSTAFEMLGTKHPKYNP